MKMITAAIGCILLMTACVSNNSPLKYVLVNQRYLKNKFVYRKTKTNFIQTNINNIDNKKILKSDFYQKDEKNNSLSNKRSFSFVGKNRIYNLSKKLKETKKLDMRDRINTNNTPTAHTSYQRIDIRLVHLSLRQSGHLQ